MAGTSSLCDRAEPEFDFYAGDAGARRAQATEECNALLSPEELASIEQSVSSDNAVVFGIQGAACTVAAHQALQARDACFESVAFDASSSLWSYFQCLYPEEAVGASPMHSYVFLGGDFVGNGFRLLLDSSDSRCATGRGMPCLSASDLDTQLSAASVQLTCSRDCSVERGRLSQAAIDDLEQAISGMAIVLYGWQSCPCTGIARNRFMSRGACYAENVWAEQNTLMMSYLNCVHGPEHHSFVWIGGEFAGNGFAFAENAMSDEDFDQRLEAADTVYSCQQDSDMNLLGTPLMSCTQDNDGTTTGWTRTGSCVWDPSDSGYHQVCVTTSQEFLQSSATNDANDLSSVVSVGGHWCICAWAWASAVSRDPENYQGVSLDCARTNARLRNVYDLHIQEDRTLQSPSGAHYQAQAALDAVEAVCAGVEAPPREDIPAGASGGSGPMMQSSPVQSVRGSLLLTTADPVTFAEDPASETAIQDAVAAMAGAGISANDVAVTISVADAGRRLRDERRLQGTVLVEYDITVTDAATASLLTSTMAAVEMADMAVQINNSLETQGAEVSVVGVEVVSAPEASELEEDSSSGVTRTGTAGSSGRSIFSVSALCAVVLLFW